MKNKKIKVIACLLAATMVLAFIPAWTLPHAQGMYLKSFVKRVASLTGITVSGGVEGTDFTTSADSVTFSGTGTYTVSGNTDSQKIIVDSNATLIFDGLNIDLSKTSGSPVTINATDSKIQIDNASSLIAAGSPSIDVASGMGLSISGTGKLMAQSNSSAIGSFGNVSIADGANITAASGTASSAIISNDGVVSAALQIDFAVEQATDTTIKISLNNKNISIKPSINFTSIAATLPAGDYSVAAGGKVVQTPSSSEGAEANPVFTVSTGLASYTGAELSMEEAPPTEAPPTEAPPTEAPPTEAPPTEAPPTEAPPTEAPPTEAPPTEAPPTEAPPTEAPPTEAPTAKPTIKPTATAKPTIKPTATAKPTIKPTATAKPTIKPTATVKPTIKPTATAKPTIKPTATAKPTQKPVVKTNVAIPAITAWSFEHDGVEKTPKFEKYDNNIIKLEGTVKATDIGEYDITLTLKDPAKYQWDKEAFINSASLSYPWKIVKPTPKKELKDNSITLDGVDGTEFEAGADLLVKRYSKSEIEEYADTAEKLSKGSQLLSIYDIKLMLNEKEIQPNGKIKITIPLTESQQKLKNLRGIYIDDNGKITLRTGRLEGSNYIIESDSLSIYGVISLATNESTAAPTAKPVVTPSVSPSASPSASPTASVSPTAPTPKPGPTTGDDRNFTPLFIIAGIALAGAVILIIIRAKKK